MLNPEQLAKRVVVPIDISHDKVANNVSYTLYNLI